MTDEQLARQVASGEAAAMDTLVRRHGRAARTWAVFELGDPALVDDATQEAWVRVLRAAASFDPTRPFVPWLRSLVQAACADQRRKEARAVRRREPLREVPSGVERDLDLARGAALALEAWSCLTPRQREVWWLCDRDGLTPTAAAAEMGVDPGTARALLHQARRAVRSELLARSPELVDVVRDDHAV